MSKTYSVKDIEDIIEAGLTGSEKSGAKTKPKAATMTPEPEVYKAPAVVATDWEATEWDGVERRVISALEIFGKGVPDVGLTQYRGFESYPQLNVPEIPEVYKPNMDALSAMVIGTPAGLKTMLVGDTGTGKTSLVEFFAAKLGRPFVRVVFDATTDDQKLFGSLEVKSVEGASETYFNKSDLTKSLAYPSVACLDEFSRANAEQTMLVNPLLDRRQVTVTSHDDSVSEKITAVDDWMAFGTDNTNGSGDDMDLYNSSNVLDEAIRNRFDIYARVPYSPEAVERTIIAQLADGKMSEDSVKKLAHFSALCHKGYSDRNLRTAFSVRNLKAIVGMFLQGMPIEQAIELNFGQRVSKSEHSDVAEMIRGIWGK